MANKVYQIVTDRVIALLERGVVPWRRPWAGADVQPQNLVSRRPYRGVNPFLLACTGFASPYWVTFKQAKTLGGSVRRGQKSTPVIFWKRWRTERIDSETGDRESVEIPILRYYNVFNAEQCDGIDVPELPKVHDFQPIERCESIVPGMANPPQIEHREARAYYRPTSDTINMPRAELFIGPEAYYGTLYHELSHSTGHSSRLNRQGIASLAAFGSADYSREELIAEMGAAFLCGHCGIESVTLDNSASYIAGWLRRLREDHRLVVSAAAAAQRAADYILGTTFESSKSE